MDTIRSFSGTVRKNVDFVMEHQLKNRESWKKFAEVYETREDIQDNGWRGEYFGKMMRGACMMYELTLDEELYDVLTEAVEIMLSKQDEYGRFSTYTIEREFAGWDIWARKYILVGMQFYHRICKDEALKAKIITAMKAHADYVVKKIGDGEGQIPITSTSNYWGGVNSCSILEPMLELYKMTGEKRYLEFAEYIISTGGCVGGDLLENVREQKKMPYEYEEVKAYETMSFFEGILAYYEVTGKSEYFEIVKLFVENVYDTDITIIGCSGCTHELFDHSKIRQTEPYEGIMQETCVTVTWMRLLDRLYKHTGDAKYMDRIEQSTLNALFGAINTKMLKQYSRELKVLVEPLAFDSYSPLFNSKRGVGVGGFKLFRSGGYYGCCACIAAAGVALYPLDAVVKKGNDIFINFFIPGDVRFTENGSDISVRIDTEYPASGTVKIKACGLKNDANLFVRIPSVAKGYGLSATHETAGGYAKIHANAFSDEIVLDLSLAVNMEIINNKRAFVYGPLTLALSQEKNRGLHDLSGEITPDLGSFEPQMAIGDECVRFTAKAADGTMLIFADYASCGKDWRNDDLMTVWMR